MNFSFQPLSISDVIMIEPVSYDDERGYFYENFRQSFFEENNIQTKFIQDNVSYSKKNVLRGLHFQKNPQTQAKFVSIVCGEIFDVAVDLRPASSTYGKWVGEKLSELNHKSLYIPEGFAHGFCVLSDEAYVLYKTSTYYSPEYESGIIWNDPSIGISWPIKTPILSKKDLELPPLSEIDNNF